MQVRLGHLVVEVVHVKIRVQARHLNRQPQAEQTLAVTGWGVESVAAASGQHVGEVPLGLVVVGCAEGVPVDVEVVRLTKLDVLGVAVTVAVLRGLYLGGQVAGTTGAGEGIAHPRAALNSSHVIALNATLLFTQRAKRRW